MNSKLISDYQATCIFFIIIFSGTNLVPVVFLPIFFLFVFVFYTLTQDSFSIYLERQNYKLIVFLVLYLLINVLYAYIIGVDVDNLTLYRREFKFIISYSFFVIALFVRSQSKIVVQVIKAIYLSSLMACLALIIHCLNPDLSFPSLYRYTTRGVVWEFERSGKFMNYLGLFQTHNAAAGFFSILIIYLAALINNNIFFYSKMLAYLALAGVLVCFYLSNSRAYSVGLVIVCMFSVLRSLKNYIFAAKEKLNIVIIFVGLAVLIFGARAPQSLNPDRVQDQWTVNGDVNEEVNEEVNQDVKLINVSNRIFYWRKALDHFYSSPIVGIGPSRFDDDVSIINTIPDYTRINVDRIYIGHGDDFQREKRYISFNLIKIDVSDYSFHTDQHPHNAYLTILSEGGIVMIFLFSVVQYLMIKSLFASRANLQLDDKNSRVLIDSTILSLVCLYIASLFGNPIIGFVPLITILAIASVVINLHDANS